jgi:hypothetical protein
MFPRVGAAVSAAQSGTKVHQRVCVLESRRSVGESLDVDVVRHACSWHPGELSVHDHRFQGVSPNATQSFTLIVDPAGTAPAATIDTGPVTYVTATTATFNWTAQPDGDDLYYYNLTCQPVGGATAAVNVTAATPAGAVPADNGTHALAPGGSYDCILSLTDTDGLTFSHAPHGLDRQCERLRHHVQQRCLHRCPGQLRRFERNLVFGYRRGCGAPLETPHGDALLHGFAAGGGVVLGRFKFRIKRHHHATIKFELTPAGRKLLLKHHTLATTLIITVTVHGKKVTTRSPLKIIYRKSTARKR